MFAKLQDIYKIATLPLAGNQNGKYDLRFWYYSIREVATCLVENKFERLSALAAIRTSLEKVYGMTPEEIASAADRIRKEHAESTAAILKDATKSGGVN